MDTPQQMAERLERLRADLRSKFVSGEINIDPAVQSQPHLDSLTGPLWLGSHECLNFEDEVWITLWAEFLQMHTDADREWVASWCLETNDMPEGLGLAINYCPFCGLLLSVKEP